MNLFECFNTKNYFEPIKDLLKEFDHMLFILLFMLWVVNKFKY